MPPQPQKITQIIDKDFIDKYNQASIFQSKNSDHPYDITIPPGVSCKTLNKSIIDKLGFSMQLSTKVQKALNQTDKIVLTKQEQTQLEVGILKYYYEAIKKKYGEEIFERVPRVLKTVLLTLFFRYGLDFDVKYVQLWNSFRKGDYMYIQKELLGLQDTSIYQRYLEVTYIKSNNSISNTQYEQIESSQNLQYFLNGIDLSLPHQKLTLNNYNIQGIYLNYQTNDIYLATKSHQNIKCDGILIEDLAIVLKIYYDPTITSKHIGFSLDPWDPKNPEGPYMRKVYWPEQIKSTAFGEALFEADYLLKQMSLGIKPNKEPFIYPEVLKQAGIQPIHTLSFQGVSETQWSRLWIVVDKINSLVAQSTEQDIQGERFAFIKNVRMGVRARRMIRDSNTGELRDADVQDPNDRSWVFAEKLSNIYDEAAHIYQSLDRMKQITKAVALGRYLYENRVPVDLKLVNQYYQQSKLTQWDEKVQSLIIQDEEIIQEEQKIPVDLKTIARRSLIQANKPTTEQNINQAVEYLTKQNIQDLYDKQIITKKRTISVFGGVNLTCSLNNQQYNIQQQQQEEEHKDFSEKIKFNSHSQIFNMTIIDQDPEITLQLKGCLKTEFPFKEQLFCSDCQNLLTPFEAAIHVNGSLYCKSHHPNTCQTCHNIILGQMVAINTKKYHPNCIFCVECYSTVTSAVLQVEEGFLHKDCETNYVYKKTEEIQNVKKKYNKIPNDKTSISDNSSVSTKASTKPNHNHKTIKKQ